eukprot:GFKZ01009535.1.p2 GENE.GFKZ01009535.1~~GFKZ01009535.1.p2  ORF type:complete len:132 (+),score=15.56 GFKZ01009535.1:607-1002(+)
MAAAPTSPPTPAPQRPPKSRPKPSPPDWLCAECNTNSTPARRGGLDGRATLCNACGLRLAKRNRSVAAAAANAANQRGDPASECTAEKDPRGVFASSGNENSTVAVTKKGKKRSASVAQNGRERRWKKKRW